MHLKGRPLTVLNVPTADSTIWLRNMRLPNGSAGSGGSPGEEERSNFRCCSLPSSPPSGVAAAAPFFLTARSSW